MTIYFYSPGGALANSCYLIKIVLDDRSGWRMLLLSCLSSVRHGTLRQQIEFTAENIVTIEYHRPSSSPPE